MLSGPKNVVDSSILDHLGREVTNVTDQARLVEILDYFSDGTSEEAFLIQNENNLNHKGVIVSAEYFAELLSYKEAIKEVFDYLVEEEKEEKNKYK
ncbi:hypothetical protein [Domibacillus robiginosus]|uniref:hypothetical protein n=1 Tax=Domibacillus robiginosus TaxID=1071054 RepID=UPI00067C1213|nr:hypothetical protein [Domibacillus robiginosus]